MSCNMYIYGMKNILLALSILFAPVAMAQRVNPDRESVKGGELTIQPITHAALVLSYQGKNLYIDPAGNTDDFKGLGAPDMILITDIHGDHLDNKAIEALMTPKTLFIVPQAVADKLPASIAKQQVVILNNDAKTVQAGITITAIPMYNLPGAANASYHTKGRGNGYVLTIGGKRIYISGDTADTPEMRALKNIDIAFVCMNLPYTMDVNAAAQGVLAFKPKVVYPYHYRGQDVNAFKSQVNTGDKNIEVRLREWYPAAK